MVLEFQAFEQYPYNKSLEGQSALKKGRMEAMFDSDQ